MVLVRDRSEVLVNPRNQFTGHELTVGAASRTSDSGETSPPARCRRSGSRWRPGGSARSRSTARTTTHAADRRSTVNSRPAARSVRGARRTRLHNDNHRLHFALREQVVENHVGPAHLDPDPLILAAAMLQIKHGITRFQVGVIAWRRIDVNVTPCIDRLGEVVFGRHMAVRHILEVVPVHARLGDFEAVAHVAIANEGLRAGVQDNRSIHDHPVVVIPRGLRRAGVGPHAVGAFHHIERNIDNRDLHLLRVGSGEVEGNPVVGFNSRILNAREVVRGRMRRHGGGAGGSHGRIDELLPGAGLRLLLCFGESADDGNQGE